MLKYSSVTFLSCCLARAAVLATPADAERYRKHRANSTSLEELAKRVAALEARSDAQQALLATGSRILTGEVSLFPGQRQLTTSRIVFKSAGLPRFDCTPKVRLMISGLGTNGHHRHPDAKTAAALTSVLLESKNGNEWSFDLVFRRTGEKADVDIESLDVTWLAYAPLVCP